MIRPEDLENKVEVFVWWVGKGMFSATPLRSYLKRLKQKDGVKKREECFKISKRMKTESILRRLVDSTKTHYWDGGFIGKELMEYLKAGILRLKKESKVTEKMNTEVTEQQSGPQPSTSQQSDPQSTTSQVKDDEKRKDNKQRVRLNQNQINGLVLKLLSRTGSSVTNVIKDISVVSGKLDTLSETFRTEMIKVNGKLDKTTETSYSEPAREKEYTKELKVTKGRDGLKWYA